MKNGKIADEARRKFGKFLVIWFSAGIFLAFVATVTGSDIVLVVGIIILCLALLKPLWKAVEYLP